MNEDIAIMILKTFFINIYTYFIFLKISGNQKINYRNLIIIILASVVGTLVYSVLDKRISQMFIIILLYFVQLIFLRIIAENRNSPFIISNLLANSLVYIGFVFSTLIELVAMVIFHIKSPTINLIVIIIIEALLVFLFFRIKRFKNGFSYLQKNNNNDYIDIIILNISLIAIIAYCLFGTYYGDLTIHLLISFIIIATVMLIMIQKTLTLYYKQRLLEKTIEGYKTDIAERDEKIEKLSDEKFKISKLNHEFYARQKSLELKVQNLIDNKNLDMETSSELSAMKQISELSKEYSKNLEKIKNDDKLPTTDIEEIDDMFKYMQSECKKSNIDFKLQINGNIQHMVNKIIPQNKLVTLIGDHIRDAIIAVDSGNNNFRSIIAVIGVKNNCYEFCVYDTGIEFEIKTLFKLGLEPATTHKDNGGTGIGFITTFETLKATKASLIIEEKQGMADNDYTKAVIIRFDGKQEYKVRSYRADKIKKENKDNRIIIENI